MNNCKYCDGEIIENIALYCNKHCAMIALGRRKLRTEIEDKGKNICRICGNYIEVRQKKFCNSSCSAKFNNPRKSKETRLKTAIAISESIKKKYKEDLAYRNKCKAKGNGGGGNKNPRRFLSVPCRICGKEIVSRAGTKYCSRSCLSVFFSENRIKNPRKCRSRVGSYKGIYCQSTYELAFVIWCKDHNREIKRCDKWIGYQWEGGLKKYNPDFEVDGTIYEIKGYIHKKVIAKLEAAKEQGIEIILIADKEEMKPFIEYVNKKYSVNILKEYDKFYTPV